MLDLQQLRCFVAVAEESHFGRAARRLNMSQPPLSRQVRLLEQRLGTALLERSTRSVRLSAAGLRFLPEAQHALAVLEATERFAGRLATGETGLLRLGFTTGASYAFLPHLIAAILAAAPDMDMRLWEMGADEQIGGLRSGKLDFGIIRSPAADQGIATRRVWQEPFCLALPSRHRLCRIGRPITAEDLGGEPFVLYSADENPHFHTLANAVMQRAGFAPGRTHHVRAVHTMLALVGAGIGLALVPDLRARMRISGVVLRPLPPELAASADSYLAWREDQRSPTIAWLLRSVLPKLPQT